MVILFGCAIKGSISVLDVAQEFIVKIVVYIYTFVLPRATILEKMHSQKGFQESIVFF